MSLVLIREPEARAKLGSIGQWLFFKQRREGLLPPPVRLSGRRCAYVTSELDAVIDARAAGAADDEVRELVSRLVQSRASRAPSGRVSV